MCIPIIHQELVRQNGAGLAEARHRGSRRRPERLYQEDAATTGIASEATAGRTWYCVHHALRRIPAQVGILFGLRLSERSAERPNPKRGQPGPGLQSPIKERLEHR